MSNEPRWICHDCAEKWCNGMEEGHLCTSHRGKCQVCWGTKSVTEPRDYGGMNEAWRKANVKD